MIPQNELLALLALSKVKMVANHAIKSLISYCGKPSEVFKLPLSKLLKIPGVGPLTAQSIFEYKGFEEAEKEIEFIAKHHIKVTPYYDKTYPYRLNDIVDAPAYIFHLGDVDFNQARFIGIVGTRKNTLYGQQFTEQLVSDLKAYNVVIVSGLAYGIDIIAHKAAVKNDIPTIGVLAHGLDKVYPAAHTNTAKQMIKGGGALIAEHFSGTIPDPENFPKRNRIVAGMIDALVVVESDLKGGSMITAKLAAGYDREVLALPGRTEDGYSKGCNYLIKTQQATLIEETNDLVKLLNWDLLNTKKQAQLKIPLDLPKDHQNIYNMIKLNGVTELDFLMTTSGLNSSRLAFVLLELEFKSLILSLPGKVYQLAR
jgi:DNA processing protein